MSAAVAAAPLSALWALKAAGGEGGAGKPGHFGKKSRRGGSSLELDSVLKLQLPRSTLRGT